jgi:hypothetical protein
MHSIKSLNDLYVALVVGAVVIFLIYAFIHWAGSRHNPDARPNQSVNGWGQDHTLGTNRVPSWHSLQENARYWANLDPEFLAVEKKNNAWVIDPAILGQNPSDNQPRDA